MDEVSCCCEFGYELQLVIPYAYYLYTKGLLNKTTSSKLTRELYYFSSNHHEIFEIRKWSILRNIPNKTPHVEHLNYQKFLPPPYKAHFKNNYFVCDKPLLIIHNKYHTEWGHSPVNYIDKTTLSDILEYCQRKYKIIYIRPEKKNIVKDHSDIHDLKEGEILKHYNVVNGNKLYQETKTQYNINNFNHFQLLLHANCENFISVQGGNCVLASYFGATNIIYAKKGSELKCNSYNGHYKKYSGCNVLHANNYTDFIKLIKNTY